MYFLVHVIWKKKLQSRRKVGVWPGFERETKITASFPTQGSERVHKRDLNIYFCISHLCGVVVLLYTMDVVFNLGIFHFRYTYWCLPLEQATSQAVGSNAVFVPIYLQKNFSALICQPKNSWVPGHRKPCASRKIQGPTYGLINLHYLSYDACYTIHCRGNQLLVVKWSLSGTLDKTFEHSVSQV